MNHSAFTLSQQTREKIIKTLIRATQSITHRGIETRAPQRIDVVLNRGAIVIANRLRIGFDGQAGFHVPDTSDIPERKVEFRGVENLQRDDFVLAMAKLAEAAGDHFKVRISTDKVAEDDDQSATLDTPGKFLDSLDQCHVAIGFGVFERVENLAQMGGTLSRGDEQVRLVAKRHEAEGVLLSLHEMTQGGGTTRGVLELGHWAGVLAVHGSRRVQQQVGPQVGLFFVLFDVESFTPGKQFPVEMSRVDAGAVGFVFRELDGEAFARRLVLAGVEAIDDQPGGEGVAAELRHRDRVTQVGVVVGDRGFTHAVKAW